MRHLRLGLALSWLLACGKDSPPSAPALVAAPTDALWQLAPPGATYSVVVADGALVLAHDAVGALLAALKAAPDGGELAGDLARGLKVEGIDLADRGAIAAAGIDLSRGAAVFASGGDDRVVVLPVGDRAAFLARFGGTTGADGSDTLGGGELTCRERAGRYVCGSSAAALASAGEGAIDVSGWPAAQRGHVEASIERAGLQVLRDAPVGEPRGLRAAVALERGGATLRVHLMAAPTGPAAALVGGARSPLIEPMLARGPSGVLALDLTPLGAMIGAAAGQIPDEVKVGEVAVRDLVGALRGDLVGWVEHGAPLRGQLQLGLVREDAVAALVSRCSLPVPVPGLTLSKAEGRCKVKLEQAQLSAPLVAELWVEHGALRVGVGPYRVDVKSPAVAATGRELAAQRLGMWGRGSSVGAGAFPIPGLDSMPQARTVIWAMAHLAELGLGLDVAADGFRLTFAVRTTFSNPPAMVADLEPLLASYARGEPDAVGKIRALAARFPDAPLAAELDAGAGALVPAGGLLGTLAAVAIPAFVKYQQKARTSEARALLQVIATGARAYAAEHGRFPTPSVGPTPPLGACCAAGGRCPGGEVAAWTREPWRALRFSVDDPHRYSYAYEVSPDGQSFTARAYGDLDCDGTYATYSILDRDPRGAAQRPELIRVNELE